MKIGILVASSLLLLVILAISAYAVNWDNPKSQSVDQMTQAPSQEVYAQPQAPSTEINGIITNPGPSLSSIPGLVLHLWHNENDQNPQLESNRNGIVELDGGDLGASEGTGYHWWMVQDDPNANAGQWSQMLPSGIVLALKHSVNQADNNRISAFGYEPVNGPQEFGHTSSGSSIINVFGGDLGASEGDGYYWYETYNPNFQDWDFAEANLPKGTILGLKHSVNQPDKTVTWRGQTYDPVQCYRDQSDAPPTFVARFGGDIGASGGEGYFWFEKETGPDDFSSTEPGTRQAVSFSENSPEYWLNQGNQRIDQGDYRRAIQAYTNACHWNDAVAYYDLGNAYYYNRNYQYAINAWQTAISLARQTHDTTMMISQATDNTNTARRLLANGR